jgi:RimJ/RimL family protein N-acetyltransferase
VTEGNEPAIRLYQSLGFRAWGTEPQAIRTPGGFRGKVHMMMSLGGPAGAEEEGGAGDAPRQVP